MNEDNQKGGEVMGYPIPDDLKLDYHLACQIAEAVESKGLLDSVSQEDRVSWMSAKREMDRDECIAKLEADNARLKDARFALAVAHTEDVLEIERLETIIGDLVGNA